jgi:hypothetical protein
LTLGCEVLGKALAKLARVVAHDVVFNGAVVPRTVEDMDANLILGDLVLLAAQHLRTYMRKKFLEKRRAVELSAGNDAFYKLPS